MGQNIIDVDDNLRLVGTAHVSSASVTLVREQIDEYGPDLVAVELCESRLKSLKRPDDLANSDLQLGRAQSELQSRRNIVCRPLLEKKKTSRSAALNL